MFRIIEYRNASGKIRMTIETDDQMAADFLRFFGSANKFVELFHFRMRMEKGTDQYQKTRPHRMALAKQARADQLKRFRELTGTRIERLRVLKEIRVCNGEKVSLDQVMAQISQAIKEEKEIILHNIKVLKEEGKSPIEISAILNLPKSTVSRHIRKLLAPKPPSEKPSVGPEISTSPKGA